MKKKKKKNIKQLFLLKKINKNHKYLISNRLKTESGSYNNCVFIHLHIRF